MKEVCYNTYAVVKVKVVILLFYKTFINIYDLGVVFYRAATVGEKLEM